MAGYNAIMSLRRLETEVNNLGFMFSHPKNGWGNDISDRVALKPKDLDALPIYARDAEIFCGTLEELQIWIRGVHWAREYDTMLRLSTAEKRERKEQDERNRQLANLLKSEIA
jgi:hypothetical protein